MWRKAVDLTDTKGICCNFEESIHKDKRLFLFEIDGAMCEVSQSIETVLNLFLRERLDFFMHRTKKGFHILSPTIISRGEWSRWLKELHHLNKKCPMITMRITPNKYPNEDAIWFHGKSHICEDSPRRNSIEMCNFLNVTFKTHFKGTVEATPKRVVYQT